MNTEDEQSQKAKVETTTRFGPPEDNIRTFLN